MKDNSLVSQQLIQQFQAQVHHAQPLVVAGQSLALFAYDLTQLDFGVVDIIVVAPLVASVVGWIDVDP